MSIVFVTSPQANAGKTAFCVAFGQRVRRLGKRVGYRRLAGDGATDDAGFVTGALHLSESAGARIVDHQMIAQALPEGTGLTLVEAGAPPGSAAGLSALSRNGLVIPLIVARYTADGLSEMIIRHAESLGVAEARVLINVVPEKCLRQVQQKIVPSLAAAGLVSIGIVPQDPMLLGTTTGELARALGAEVVCASDDLDQPIEAVMISAMSDEGAEPYFRRHSRKAVVAAGDRPDIHLPALATDTSCIILTEGRDPDPTVFKTADQSGVPLLKVELDTISTLERISDALDQVRFHQPHKVARVVAHFSAHVTVDALITDLGLSQEAAR